MKKTIALLFLSLSMGVSANCVEFKNDAKVSWTAFKTPAKAGVSGIFKDVNFRGKMKGTKVLDIVSGMSFNINAASVFSKDLARDKKISTHIFSTLVGGAGISGIVKSIKKDTALVDITMNAVTKTVPLKFSIKGNSFTANGVIDMFDYTMNSQVAALNKACFAKHEGKTWSDVKVSITANFKSCK